ncbi:MAG: aminoacyl-tRNA hydrolase [Chromatiales bacterium]|nr:aminoacyl-tRNA hydrolase [Chromatiales bacterium]
MSDTSPLRMIVGLGNPGGQYQDTRHNVGFWLVERLATEYGAPLRAENKFHGAVAKARIGDQECWLLTPTTFMNRSGQSVSALAGFYKIAPGEILVVHDELDLEPGTVRLKRAGGHGGHNGLRDIISALGSPDFHRLRIGIGHPGDRNQVVNFVLSNPSKSDRQLIDEAIDRALTEIPSLLRGEAQITMNRLHSRR